MLYGYRYDQLNRIWAMLAQPQAGDAWRGLNTTNNTWGNGFAQLDVYKERVSYDANGNILRYLRHGNKTGTPVMDSLHYKYTYASGKLQNNRLNWVSDNAAAADYADDIDNQGAGNYTYDAIGNLMSDAKDSISNIQWNVYGKIMEIQRIPSAARPVSNIRYSYDAGGNRIGRRVAKYNSTAVDYTWYVRDASGNVMGTYGYTSTGTNDLSGANLLQNEVYLYGSSRLGSLAVNRNVEDTLQLRDSSLSLPLGLGNLIKGPFVRGIKQYELSNHLGNVLVTISDRKLGVDDGTYDSSSVTGLLEKINGTKDGKVDWYVADVVTAGDYYPFGSIMPGRNYSQANTKYRYGFNGKEKDNDIAGEGNIYDYGFRIYNPRLGRFLSVDPLSSSYPFYTPYQFAGNKPIAAIDLDGLEEFVVIYYRNLKGKIYKTEIRTIKVGDLVDQNIKVVYQGNKIGDKIANGNVLVFDVYNEGVKDKELYIVDESRNLVNGVLTAEENRLYKEKSKQYKAPSDHKSFAYPNNNEEQYESDAFDNPQFFIATKLAPKLPSKTINGFTSFDVNTGKHVGQSWEFEDYSQDGRSFNFNNDFTKYLKAIKEAGNVDEINIDIKVFNESDDYINAVNKISSNVKGEFIKYVSKVTGVTAKNINVNLTAKKGNKADNAVEINVNQ
jgi:RHS repeat-associated protein